jgi:hypothetical protein
LPSLPDDEGGLLLLTDALSEIDRFSYRSSMHHPLISNPEGISLERVSSFKASADAGNWHSASSTSGFATPGIRNSQDLSGQQIPEGDWLTLSSRLFSPDNDGRSDLLQLHVTWPKPGFMGRIVIFDETGNQVRELGAMELSGTASDWLWDGRDAEGEPCDEGIYFLIARFLHIEGEVLQCRTSCVLARAD